LGGETNLEICGFVISECEREHEESEAFLAAVLLGLFFAGLAAADTWNEDGRVFERKYLGGTQAVLRYEINGGVQTFTPRT